MQYDLVVNLNYDIRTSLLLDFFERAEKKGFMSLNKSSKTSTAVLRKGIANYFFNSVKNRSLNTINIVDIFSLMGLNMPAKLKDSYHFLDSRTNQDIEDHKIATGIKYINRNYDKIRVCISTGASSEKRIWNISSYAKLIELLIENLGCEITLVGATNDINVTAEIKNYLPAKISKHLIDITGKTSLNEFIHAIKNFDLIISSDTGTLHIAQIFNIPSVSIFIGNANFYETGPHLRKSIVIYSKADCYPCIEKEPCRFNFACKKDIDPNDVFELAKLTIKRSRKPLSSDRDTEPDSVENSLAVRIRNNNFDVSFCEHVGFIHYYPLSKKEICKNDLASEVLKPGWIYIFSRKNVELDIDKILKCCKRYYKINRVIVNTLISELLFIRNVFENGKQVFIQNNNCNASYFSKFKEFVKLLGNNYGYLKLLSDYFVNEVTFENSKNIDVATNVFDDMILLFGNAIGILKQL